MSTSLWRYQRLTCIQPDGETVLVDTKGRSRRRRRQRQKVTWFRRKKWVVVFERPTGSQDLTLVTITKDTKINKNEITTKEGGSRVEVWLKIRDTFVRFYYLIKYENLHHPKLTQSDQVKLKTVFIQFRNLCSLSVVLSTTYDHGLVVSWDDFRSYSGCTRKSRKGEKTVL